MLIAALLSHPNQCGMTIGVICLCYDCWLVVKDVLYTPKADDPVNHPEHYTSHPSGVECIQITEHMGFCIGNAVKYLWRADMKGRAIEDLEKARFYIDREIAKRKAGL